MSGHKGWRRFRWWPKLVVFGLILALVPACQINGAQYYIPLAYGATGLCIALLMSPTPAAAVVGFLAGGLLGAAVYNNSLKHQIADHPRPEP